jgi:outer membrane protein assembly factor BamB
MVFGTSASAQIYRLPAPDSTAGNYFGDAAAIDGGVTVVGASGEPTCGINSGAAFVYEVDEIGDWNQTAHLVPDDCREETFFGKAVAISGNRILVASYIPFFSGQKSNSVYVFDKNLETGSWEQTSKITHSPNGDEGPFAASISLDHDRILITTSGDTSTGEYGGVAYVYDLVDGKWIESARLTGSLGTRAGIFGTSSALEGDRVIVSASTYMEGRAGAVYVYDRDTVTGSWIETSVLLGILDFFISVDISGDRILVGESKAGRGGRGRARIFEPDEEGKWRASASLIPKSKKSQGDFGSIVSLQDDTALVRGFDEQLSQNFNIDRVIYLFKYEAESGDWVQRHIIDVGNNNFGSAMDMTPGTAIIGLASDAEIGQAYVVRIR